MRDFQQNKVYTWETQFPSGRIIEFDFIQGYVNYVWEDLGLKYPPKVRPIAKQTRKWAGKANRYSVWLHETGSTEHTILHELAHSLTIDIDGNGAVHDEKFVGMFMVLLEKYMNVSIFHLWASADKAGVKYEKFSKPRIVDEEGP